MTESTDADLLAAVERALSRPVQKLTDVGRHELDYDAFLAHRAVFRLSGVAESDGEQVPWSMIEKTTEGPHLAIPYLTANGDREYAAYASGLLDHVAPSVRAPSLYASAVHDDGRTVLWLEEIRHDGGRPLNADDLLAAAADLGGLAGRWLGEDLSAPWFFRGWIDRHSQPHAAAAGLATVRRRSSGVVARLGGRLEAAERLILGQHEIRAVLERLPQTLCHHDAVGANVFRAAGRTVLIDWESVGPGPVGADLASLLFSSVRRGDASAQVVVPLLEDALSAYTEALRAEAPSIALDVVRVGLDAANALRWKLAVDVVDSLERGEVPRRGSLPDEKPEDALEELLELVDALLASATRVLTGTSRTFHGGLDRARGDGGPRPRAQRAAGGGARQLGRSRPGDGSRMTAHLDVASGGGATGGAVATSNSLATEAGTRALRLGGNAIDAAIAAAAALCVVYPNNVAIGGDLVALVRDPEGRTSFVNATGRAARGATLEDLRARHGDALPDRGIDTVTVPGGVRGWKTLAGLGARLGWPELLDAAQRLAVNGHPVARSVAGAIAAEREVLDADLGCRSVFLPGGTPLAQGDLLRQPALGRTLELLAANGPDAFYSGTLAERWVAGLAALGSRITVEDAAASEPTVQEPISLTGLGVEVFTSPPNTQGFSLLRTLRVLAEETIGDPLGHHADRLAEVFAENNRIRSHWLADPDVGVGAGELLAMPAPPEDGDARAASGDTVGLVAVSDDGWAVSLVQSVYWAFGAGVLEPETGVLFHNRGTSFSLDPAHPAAFAGGRRPPHTLMPVLVDRGGRLAYAAATMGGQAQAQIHAHLLLRLLSGASAAEAASAPRWVVGAQGDGDTVRTLTVEADVAAAAQESLAGTALDIKVVPAHNELLGHSNVIAIVDAGYDAASDPRSDGSALVVDGSGARGGAP